MEGSTFGMTLHRFGCATLGAYSKSDPLAIDNHDLLTLAHRCLQRRPSINCSLTEPGVMYDDACKCEPGRTIAKDHICQSSPRRCVSRAQSCYRQMRCLAAEVRPFEGPAAPVTTSFQHLTSLEEPKTTVALVVERQQSSLQSCLNINDIWNVTQTLRFCAKLP